MRDNVIVGYAFAVMTVLTLPAWQALLTTPNHIACMIWISVCYGYFLFYTYVITRKLPSYHF